MKPFNKIRLAYLDDLEEDPEVQEAIKPSNKVILGEHATDANLVDAIRPLYNREVTVFYGDPSTLRATRYEDSGILLDPKAGYPEGVIKYGMPWSMEGLNPTALVTKIKEPNHVEYLENLSSVRHGSDWVVVIDYSKGIIYMGPKKGLSDHV